MSLLLLATPTLHARVLDIVSQPDVAVLLLLGGLLLLYLEFNLPGTVLPGALGILCIALALYGFSALPIRHTAVVLLLASLLLILTELKFPTHGLLAMLGTAALVFGLLTLVDAPAPLGVHAGTAVAAGIAFGSITFFLARLALIARRNKALSGAQTMIGLVATVRTPLAPGGQVEVRGELWQAVSPTPLALGEKVVITGMRGLLLHVSPQAAPTTPAKV